jgi:hypothetical protein
LTGFETHSAPLGAGNEKNRRLKAEDLVDDSVVQKLEKEGRL